jgi:O-antigen/teichoic acid export membrane protein
MLNYEKRFKKNKWFLSNLLNLSLVNVFNFASPFITLPILIIALGQEKYGEYVFYYTLFSLFGFILNFGTTQSGLLLFKKNQNDETSTFWEIIILKCLIFSFVIALTVPLLAILDFELDSTYLLLCFIPIFEIISSDWIFHKKEKLHHLALITFFYRLIPVTYVLVVNQHLSVQGFLIACNFGLLLSTLISTYIIKSYGVKILKINLNVFITIKYLAPFFFPFIIGKLKLNFIKIGLGIEGNFSSITIYDFLDKIKSGYILPSQITADAFLGRNTTNPKKKRLNTGLKITVFLGLFLFAIVYLIVKKISNLKLFSLELSNNILLLFLALGLVQSIVYFLTKNFLIPNGYISYLNRLTLTTGLILFLTILLTFVQSNSLLMYGLVSYLLIECVSLCLILNKLNEKNRNSS